MTKRFITKGRGKGRRVIPLSRQVTNPQGRKVKINPMNISKRVYVYGGKDKDGKEIVYRFEDIYSPHAVDIADSYHLETVGVPRHFGWDCSKGVTDEIIRARFSEEGVRFVDIPKDYKCKERKPDFIDQIISYESGDMTPDQENKFLLKNKDVLVKLQGHYGRAISNLEKATQ